MSWPPDDWWAVVISNEKLKYSNPIGYYDIRFSFEKCQQKNLKKNLILNFKSLLFNSKLFLQKDLDKHFHAHYSVKQINPISLIGYFKNIC